MATNERDKAAPPPPPAKEQAAKAGPWRIRVPAGAGFTRVHTPFRLRFVDGVAETADPAAARFCTDPERDYEVTDLSTGKVLCSFKEKKAAKG